MRFKIAAALSLLGIASPVAAHDFWIDSDTWLATGEQADIQFNLLIGTALEPEHWTSRPEKIVSLRTIAPDGRVTDQAGNMIYSTDDSEFDAKFTLAGAGTHIISFESTPAAIELPAGEFNEYIEHEGLAAVIAHREATAATDKPGRELYARRAKAIVQLGANATPLVTSPVGQSLEIVPLVNPYMPGVTNMPVAVHFRGQPLAGVQVEMENLLAAELPAVRVITDSEGKASFPITQDSIWKISCVWSVPVEDTKRADYDTLFSSLTFGFIK